MRLGDILRLAARRTPRKIAIVADDRELAYAEFDRQANRFAHLLAGGGVVKGDRVACILFNGPEYAVVHFGNARAGSVLVHVSPAYAAPEIARIVERTRPRILVVDETVLDKVAGLVSARSSSVPGKAPAPSSGRYRNSRTTRPASISIPPPRSP